MQEEVPATAAAPVEDVPVEDVSLTEDAAPT